MFASLLDSVFGCSHKRTTFPITVRKTTHVTCLECGKEFEYNWNEMRMASQEYRPLPVATSGIPAHPNN